MARGSKIYLEGMKAAKEFSDYMNNLTISEHGKIVIAICDKCMVSRSQVYLWKACRSGIKPLFRKCIEEAAGRKIFS